MNKLNAKKNSYANELTEFPECLYYISHISDKKKGRYFRPLVCKEKAE
jgi:hypothetical protein